MGSFQSGHSGINLKQLIITSIISGFFLIPVHEFGHVICHWASGNPAGMSYARDYLLNNGKYTFIGELGGPMFPILIALVAVILIYKSNISISILYPVAVLGCMDRLILYLSGMLPSDERDLAAFMHWDVHSFVNIFMSAEIILLALIIFSMFRYNVSLKMKILCVVIPIVAFVAMAAFGVLVVERYVFPVQFHLQFG